MSGPLPRPPTAPALPLLALVIGACGLAGSSEPSRPVPGDGVGNFGSAAPIELCLGSARVVAPSSSSSAGAVCVREGSHGKACGAGAACSGIERCVCGRCIVEGCLGGASCGEGRVCRDKRCTAACAADADCAAGERCRVGGCARPCTADAGCHFGERCDDLGGVCVTKTCSAAIACGPGDACEAEEVTGELHEPDVIALGDGAVAFVEIRGGIAGPGGAIYRARLDGRRWTADPAAPVLAPDAGERVGAPAALVRDGRVELFFAAGDGAAIRRAVSTDGGRTFARDAAPVLVPARPWEKGWVGSPAAVVRNGETLLFYEGGPRAGVGLARLDAAGAATAEAEPVITPARVEDPLFWRGVTEVSAPAALVVDDAIRVYFTARGAEGGDALTGDAGLPAERNDSIGLFTTRDLARFDPYPNGPVLARVANLRAYLGEREATVRLGSDALAGAEITFVATDASGAEVSGLARAPE